MKITPKVYNTFLLAGFLSILLNLIPASGLAQRRTAIGFQVGVNLGFEHVSNPEVPIDRSSLAGLAIDAHTDWRIIDDVALQDQLMYIDHRINTRYDAPLGEVRNTTSYKYLNLELAPKYKFGSDPLREYVFLGPSIGYLLSASTETIHPDGSVTQTSFTDQENTLNLALTVGGRLILQTDENIYLHSQVAYSYELINTTSSKATGVFFRDLRFMAGVLLEL